MKNSFSVTVFLIDSFSKKIVFLFIISLIAAIVFFPITTQAQSTIINYSADSTNFPNPERGFLNQICEFPNSTALTASTLQTMRQKGFTIVRIYYQIGSFRDSPMSESFLTRIQNELDLVRENGFKMSPYFTYSGCGGGLPPNGIADAEKSRILEHLNQLETIIKSNADVIPYIENGFVGFCGEWWGAFPASQYHGLIDYPLANYHCMNAESNEILNKILDILPTDRFYCIRYPYYKSQTLENSFPITTSYVRDFSVPLSEAYSGS